jgi:hypothetical protein
MKKDLYTATRMGYILHPVLQPSIEFGCEDFVGLKDRHFSFSQRALEITLFQHRCHEAEG